MGDVSEADVKHTEVPKPEVNAKPADVSITFDEKIGLLEKTVAKLHVKIEIKQLESGLGKAHGDSLHPNIKKRRVEDKGHWQFLHDNDAWKSMSHYYLKMHEAHYLNGKDTYWVWRAICPRGETISLCCRLDGINSVEHEDKEASSNLPCTCMTGCLYS